MDYSKLSDFEINFLVAEALNKFEYVSDHNAEGGSAVLCDSLRDCDTYDYCNDPSDAWPIITENKIAIKPKLITKKNTQHLVITLMDGRLKFTALGLRMKTP